LDFANHIDLRHQLRGCESEIDLLPLKLRFGLLGADSALPIHHQVDLQHIIHNNAFIQE